MSRRDPYVGRPVERLEDLRFLTGRGRYVDDLRPEGLLHAAIFRSSVAHGLIRSLDVTAARALPGVHAVITASDIDEKVPAIPSRMEPNPDLARFEQPVIAHRKVRYVGEPMVLVVAESAALAEDAVGTILADIDPLPVVTSRETSESGTVLLFEEDGTNRAITLTAVRGDAEAAMREADYVRRERLRVQRHTALPMETRGLLAEWDAGASRLTISGLMKVPFAIRALLARVMNLPEDPSTPWKATAAAASACAANSTLRTS
jgi:carbon-monoxide dehydrogenase large subunit